MRLPADTLGAAGRMQAAGLLAIITATVSLMAADASAQTTSARAVQHAKPAAEQTFRVTTSPSAINPFLARAFDAFNAGDLSAAAHEYTQLLAAEPQNLDALHGMAAIALRQGHSERAEDFYQRAIAADPKDAIALAGLSGLRGHIDPVAAESRLKNLIATQPGQHLLFFALGNIYAATSRWHEAQQAFFSAYSADAGHPDYLFNLAVSLDHLRQFRLAAHYYDRAIAAANHRPAAFDRTRATARWHEIVR